MNIATPRRDSAATLRARWTRGLRRLGAALALMAGTAAAVAQPFPNRPLTIVVPFGAGGLTDQLAREVGALLSQSLKQPVVVDNKPGGGGQIAVNAVRQAPADGHTLLLADIGVLALNVSLFSKLNFDPRKDLQAVSQLITAPQLVVVPKDRPFQTFADLVQAAKARNLSYASQGVGAGGHLFGTQLAKQLGVPITHVAYRGSGPALNDVAAGQVDFLFDAITTAGAFVKADKIRALAIGTDRRSPQFPTVPTLKELGYESLITLPWFGVMVKAGTPEAVVERLNAEVVAALRDPALSKKLQDQGLEIVGSSPRDFTAFIQSETTRWARVIREAGMSVE